MNASNEINADIEKLIETSKDETITATSVALALRNKYAGDLDPAIEYGVLEQLKTMAGAALHRMYGETQPHPYATPDELQNSAKAFFDHADALEADGEK